ncbi:MAG: YkgJ family cysteine cluster protein, partial [Thermoplasmata archaeon]
MNSITEIPELDVRLLSGFAFSCRPDCGLCCYAEPRVAGSEKARLLQIVPEAEFVARGVDEFLAAHPDGGACRQLVDSRCRAHIARPHPCREYPVSVHVGERLQASLVLSCPGVDLTVLGASSPPSPSSPVLGLADELAAVRERVDRSTARRIEASARRRRKIERRLEEAGRWEDETVVRDRFRRTVPMPSAHDFPVPDPPSASDGVELLPLFFDHRSAPIALSSGRGGWE